MKKTLLMLAAAAGAYCASAQNINPNGDYRRQEHTGQEADSACTGSLGGWCIDLNLMGGGAKQNYTTRSMTANYPGAINDNTSNLRFDEGGSFGIDLQAGYFFDNKGHFGFGAGLQYMHLIGNATLDRFHIEYQAYDYRHDVYRQVVDATKPVKESLNISDLSIPVVFKYKTKITSKIDFTADAGVLFNLMAKNKYTADAAFDYGAIYKFARNENGIVTVYETAPVPATTDLIIDRNHGNGDINQYFSDLQSRGYNVGTRVAPTGSGSVTYNSLSVGFLVRPAISFWLSDAVALNVGGYYAFQNFKHDAPSGYKLTDWAGGYSTVLNSVSSAATHIYGVNVGLRIMLNKMKDSDGDGVPDGKDRCPYERGPKKFKGCPDRDNDGIPDADDNCPTTPGLEKFNGCPDTDGDGIIDNEDACPTVPGLAEFDGCPDTDGDGVPDNEDKCPDVAGPASNHGCPESMGKPGKYEIETEKAKTKNKVSISTPILFEENKTVIKPVSEPVLQEAADQAKHKRKTYLEVNGYADNIGKAEYNKAISKKRAEAVKRSLEKKGVSSQRIQTIAHGSDHPVASNKTMAGRARNRRVVIKLKHGSPAVRKSAHPVAVKAGKPAPVAPVNKNKVQAVKPAGKPVVNPKPAAATPAPAVKPVINKPVVPAAKSAPHAAPAPVHPATNTHPVSPVNNAHPVNHSNTQPVNNTKGITPAATHSNSTSATPKPSRNEP